MTPSEAEAALDQRMRQHALNYAKQAHRALWDLQMVAGNLMDQLHCINIDGIRDEDLPVIAQRHVKEHPGSNPRPTALLNAVTDALGYAAVLISELEQVTTEKELCDRIERELREKGFEVLREAPVPGGRIDILANRSGEQWVIEAKLVATRRTVAAALGQLLSYRHYRGGSRLFFAAPVEVPDDLVALLLGHGIEVYS